MQDLSSINNSTVSNVGTVFFCKKRKPWNFQGLFLLLRLKEYSYSHSIPLHQSYQMAVS